VPNDGKRFDGTLTHVTPIGSLDQMMLSLSVANYVGTGACKDRMTSMGAYCLTKPWRGSGYGVADPYVYVDPSWEYATRFLLEMSADETNTEWVVPQRTLVDLETLTGLVDGDGGVGVDGAVGRSTEQWGRSTEQWASLSRRSSMRAWTRCQGWRARRATTSQARWTEAAQARPRSLAGAVSLVGGREYACGATRRR
jgi:hypothetical protein